MSQELFFPRLQLSLKAVVQPSRVVCNLSPEINRETYRIGYSESCSQKHGGALILHFRGKVDGKYPHLNDKYF